MEILLEDYKRRIETALDMLSSTKDNGGINDTKKMERIRTKISCYRTFIAELEREMANTKQTESNFSIPVVVFSEERAKVCKRDECWKECVTWINDCRCIKDCDLHKQT